MLNFKAFEMMKEKVEQHKDLCEKNNELRAAAKAELNEAKAEKQVLLDRQIAGESVMNELLLANSKLEVAEEKYKRLVATVGENNALLDLQKDVRTLSSELRTVTNTSGIREQMKDELEALDEAKKLYFVAAEKALIKFHKLQNYVTDVENQAYALSGERVGDPIVLPMTALRPELWVGPHDFNNEFCRIKEQAKVTVNGQMIEVKGPNIGDVLVTPKQTPAAKEKVYTDETGVTWERQNVGFERVALNDQTTPRLAN